MDESIHRSRKSNYKILERRAVSQHTLIIIKPDGVSRGMVGTVMARFEAVGLSIVNMRLCSASQGMIEAQYPPDEEWLLAVGTKTLRDYKKRGLNPTRTFGTAIPEDIGRTVLSWLHTYLLEGPIVPAVLHGNDAVAVVRKLIGDTLPANAAPGTIRGDYGIDSATLAAEEGRAVRNIIHGSGSVEEASRECGIWFGEQWSGSPST